MLAFAGRIAKLPSVTILLLKEAVNETQDPTLHQRAQRAQGAQASTC
jgi:hypothetical protein